MTDGPIKCRLCRRVLDEGEEAWASDWKAIDVSGTTVTIRTVARYACDDCEGSDE